eukprot:408482-Rhodomonas_salina.5
MKKVLDSGPRDLLQYNILSCVTGFSSSPFFRVLQVWFKVVAVVAVLLAVGVFGTEKFQTESEIPQNRMHEQSYRHTV